MTVPLAAVLALATFLAGLFLGRRSTARRHRDALAHQAARLQRVIDFADDYIERTAPAYRLLVIRNDDGHIVELAMRCGTSAIAARELLENQRRQKSLH